MNDQDIFMENKMSNVFSLGGNQWLMYLHQGKKKKHCTRYFHGGTSGQCIVTRVKQRSMYFHWVGGIDREYHLPKKLVNKLGRRINGQCILIVGEGGTGQCIPWVELTANEFH